MAGCLILHLAEDCITLIEWTHTSHTLPASCLELMVLVGKQPILKIDFMSIDKQNKQIPPPADPGFAF